MTRRKQPSPAAAVAGMFHVRPAAPPPVPMSSVAASDIGVVSVSGAELGKITQLLDLRPLDNLLEAHEAIRRGLPVHSVEHLIETLPALPIDQALEAALGMSARTLQRKRAARTKSLNPEQSGRVWKFAEVLAKARDVFGSSEQAATWLSCPATGLNQQRPIDLLATLAGAELVQQFLGRLEYGVYT